jgi:anti-sigma factor RsiW
MKPWTEENYLERLMPDLRQAKRVNMESCPDSELLSAYAEDQLDPFMRGAVTAHLAKCRECAELCSRLENFNRAAIPIQDSEWVNTEKRLDNWSEAFLKAQTPAPVEANPESHRVPGLKEAPKTAFSWWKFVAVAGAMATVVIVIGGVMLTRHGNPAWFHSASRSPVQMAQQQTRQLPAPTASNGPAATGPSTLSASSPGASDAASSSGASSLSKPSAAGNVNNVPLHSVHPRRPANAVISQDAANQQLASAPAHEQPLPPGSVASHTAAPVSNSPSAIAANPASNEVAQTYSAPQNPNDRIGMGANNSANTPAHSMAIENTAVLFKPPVATPQAAPKAHHSPPTGEAPPSVRFDAGARLWIHLNSTNPLPDGSFTFQGSLIQPAANAVNKKSLDPGTQLSGSGLDKGGRVTVLVKTLTIQGITFVLPGAASGSGASMNEQMPGSGKALQFQNGNVLEVWITVPSTYARSSGTAQ